MLRRREFLGAACAPLLGAQRQKPNVLLFTSDQESALLPAELRLPNRRRLQERGATFSHAFCNTPQCSPARGALLTGLQPWHNGVVTNVDGSSLGIAPSPELPSLGSVFRSAGYATGYFGKWHLGAKGPSGFGFETEQTGFGQARGGQSDVPAAQAAAEWIAKQKGPWMAWVSLINPHDIYFPPGGYEKVALRPGARAPSSGTEALANKPAEQTEFARRARSNEKYQGDGWLRYRSYYCELVEKVDASLGVVLDAAGDLDSTIVAYTSDHGDGLGEHGLPFKGPFMYEELVRIPLVIAAPANAAGRGVRDDFATQADVLPTLAALAGIPAPPKLDGINIAAKGKPRDAVLLEYCGQQHNVYPIRTIRTRHWKLNWYDSGGKELYDLEHDPHELHNLAGTPEARRVQQELEGRLEAWRPPLTELERRQPGKYLKAAAAPRREKAAVR